MNGTGFEERGVGFGPRPNDDAAWGQTAPARRVASRSRNGSTSHSWQNVHNIRHRGFAIARSEGVRPQSLPARHQGDPVQARPGIKTLD